MILQVDDIRASVIAIGSRSRPFGHGMTVNGNGDAQVALPVYTCSTDLEKNLNIYM
jgi:hypothetical protein